MPLPKDTKEPDYLIVVEHKGFKATFDIKSKKARVRYLKAQARNYWGYQNHLQFSLDLFYQGKELNDSSNFEKIPHLSELHLEVNEDLNAIVFNSNSYYWDKTRGQRFSLMIRALFIRIGSTYIWRAIAYLFSTAFGLFKKTFPFFRMLYTYILLPSLDKIIVPFFSSPPCRYIFTGGLFNHIRLFFRTFLSPPLSFLVNHTVRPLWNSMGSLRAPFGRFLLSVGRSFGSYIFEPSIFYIIEPFFSFFVKPTFQITANCIKIGYSKVFKPSALLFHRLTKNLPIFKRFYAIIDYWNTGTTRFIESNTIKFDLRPVRNCDLVQSDAIDNNPHYYMEKGTKYYFVFAQSDGFGYRVVEILRNGVSVGRYFIQSHYETTVIKGEEPFPFNDGFHFLMDEQLENIGEFEDITFNFYNLGEKKKKQPAPKKLSKAQRKAARKAQSSNNNNNNEDNTDANNNTNNDNYDDLNYRQYNPYFNNNNNNDDDNNSKKENKSTVSGTGVDVTDSIRTNQLYLSKNYYPVEDTPFHTFDFKIYPKSVLK